MTKLTITAEFANQAAALKSPWVINNGIDLKGPFAGREAARTAKAENDIGGKVEKFEIANFEIEAEKVDLGTTIFAFEHHGMLKCPGCGTHLSNGVGIHNDEVNGRTIKHAEFEYKCLACDTEFGPAIELEVAPVEKAPKKTIAHVNTSTIASPTKAVWHIADELKEKGITRRKDVVAECIARGIANFTARTQYQQWFTVQKEMATREAKHAEAESANHKADAAK